MPDTQHSARTPRVVVVGAGFAGLAATRRLRRAPVEVVLVDRQNHHLFQPLLYQVAMAGLSGPDVAAPVRRILRGQANASVLFAEVRGFDLEGRRVLLDDGDLEFDFLVVAVGSTHGYFGHDEWARFAPGLKTLADAQEIRARVLRAFERAERITDDAEREPWLRLVVVGGGPTGVELAGALAELARRTLARDFRRFDPKRTQVLLLEGGPRVLPTFSERLSQRALEQLRGLGVDVRLDARVTGVDEGGVDVGDERIESRTVLWAAGVQASPLLEALGAELDEIGRVKVRPDLSLPDHPSVYVVGDAAHVEQDDGTVPGLAPAAIQMGRHAADAIRDSLVGDEPRPFRYEDKGAMATIGRKAAVAQIGRREVSGPIAWLLWLGVHLVWLIGFRSKVVVLINWAWSYVTYQRVARVIAESATERREEHAS